LVSLHHVASFLLDDDILNHIFLLRRIDLATNCCLSLKVEHQANKPASITEMGHCISRSLLLGGLERVAVELEQSAVTGRGHSTARSAPHIQVNLRYPGRLNQASVAHTLLSSLPFLATTALELVFRDPHAEAIPVEAWRMCLQNFGAVESLHVRPTTPRNLLSALVVTCDPVLFPRLQCGDPPPRHKPRAKPRN
jgi:hypothetical protein